MKTKTRNKTADRLRVVLQGKAQLRPELNIVDVFDEALAHERAAGLAEGIDITSDAFVEAVEWTLAHQAYKQFEGSIDRYLLRSRLAQQRDS